MLASWKQCCSSQTYKGNIMLLILFVMFVSALLWLLVSQYVQHLIKISSLFQDYYKSYYYAYAWVETALAQVKHHGYGFEDDDVFEETNEYICGNKSCETDYTIVSRWRVLADSYHPSSLSWSCGDISIASWADVWQYYDLPVGGAIILPLFKDQASDFDAPSYDFIATSNDLFSLDIEFLLAWWLWAWDSYLLKVIDEDLTNNSSYTVNTSSFTLDAVTVWGQIDYTWNDVNNKHYLIIANPSWDPKKLCMQLGINEKVVNKYIVIESTWRYGKTSSSLSAIKVDQLPSFLWYGTINSW